MKRAFCTLGFCILIASPYPAVAGKKGDAIKTIEAESIQKDVALSASIPDKQVAGTPVHLKVTVQNRSTSDVQFRARMMYFEYELHLLDAKGVSVPLTRFGQNIENARKLGGSSVTVTLAPGKSMEATLNVARVFDLTTAGEYTLRIGRDLDGINLKIEGMKFQVTEGP